MRAAVNATEDTTGHDAWRPPCAAGGGAGCGACPWMTGERAPSDAAPTELRGIALICLTTLQCEIFVRVAEGDDCAAIAESVGISRAVVRRQFAQMDETLGACGVYRQAVGGGGAMQAVAEHRITVR